MFDSAGLAGWVETAMELAPGTLVSSKDRRDPSYAISHQLGNAGQTRVATRGRVSMRGIRARILPPRGCRWGNLGRVESRSSSRLNQPPVSGPRHGPHVDPRAGAKCDERSRGDRRRIERIEPEVPAHRGDDQGQFSQGEQLPGALARANTEGDEGPVR